MPPIPQPPLRTPLPNERVVRTAGLKFILPCKWKPGDVLDEAAADFINSAWHTAVLNRFGEIRNELLNDPRTTYEDLDQELQTFFDSFQRNPRKGNPSVAPVSEPSEDEREHLRIIKSWSRSIFRANMANHGLTKESYEEAFRKWFDTNRSAIEAEYNREQEAIAAMSAFIKP